MFFFVITESAATQVLYLSLNSSLAHGIIIHVYNCLLVSGPLAVYGFIKDNKKTLGTNLYCY